MENNAAFCSILLYLEIYLVLVLLKEVYKNPSLQ